MTYYDQFFLHSFTIAISSKQV